MGIGLSWLAIVAAEMLIGGVGIGFFIWDAWNSSHISEIILALIYVGIIGFVLDRIVAARCHHCDARHRGQLRGQTMSAYLQIDHLSKTFTRGAQETEVLHDITLTVDEGRLRLDHRPLRMRQVHAAQHRGGPCCSPPPAAFWWRTARSTSPDRTARSCSRTTRCCHGSPSTTMSCIAVNKVFGGKKSRAERHDWVMHNLDLVQREHAKDKRPAEISGGMKQRVGLARALSMEPKVLLLDEPFGALDALTRAHLQDLVMAIHAKLGNTVLMITHDVDEAVLLSDRIVMMTNGPSARIGEVLEVPLARPRKRLSLAADPTYLKVPPARARIPLRTASLRGSGVTFFFF